jgi:N-acyl-D-aspartate/D-glutamate deacylase
MGPSDHRPSAAEISKMSELVRQGLQQGAWGISAGLDYKPAYFATTDEVTKIVESGAPWRTNFPNHERIMPPQFSSRAGIAETILIGSRSGVAPEITHIKAQGREQGKGPEIVALMTDASRAGHYTPADVYPYLAGLTGLQDLLIPGWAQDGGPIAMRSRFNDPELRARIARESEAAMDARLTGGPKGVQLLQLNKSLVDVMNAEQVGAGEAVIRTLEAAGDRELYALLQFGVEADLEAFLRYDGTAIACDCGATLLKLTHPRAYGTFPRVLGRYVREKQILTWEQAVAKMTGLPASTIGMVDRGVLNVGMRADVTVFDPTKIIDRSTYTQPSLMPEGVNEVLVNGRSEWHAGRATGSASGSVVFRSRHMPTRPLDSLGDRHARAVAAMILTDVVDGKAKGRYRLNLDVAQSASNSKAAGTVVIESGAGDPLIEILEFGELQRSDRWLALSGIARWAGKIEPINLILDAADPDADHESAALIVDSATRHAEFRLAASSVEMSAGRPRVVQ